MAAIQDALAALRGERSEAEAELRALEARVAELDRAIASIDAVSGDGRRLPRGGGRSGARRAGAKRGRPRGAITEAILGYLDAQGRGATHASEILRHLEGQGVAPVGAHPKASLANTLIRLERQGKVRNIGRNRWRRVRRG